MWDTRPLWRMACESANEAALCRLHEAEAILDEAIPELTELRTRNAQLSAQVRLLVCTG